MLNKQKSQKLQEEIESINEDVGLIKTRGKVKFVKVEKVMSEFERGYTQAKLEVRKEVLEEVIKIILDMQNKIRIKSDARGDLETLKQKLEELGK